VCSRLRYFRDTWFRITEQSSFYERTMRVTRLSLHKDCFHVAGQNVTFLQNMNCLQQEVEMSARNPKDLKQMVAASHGVMYG
jgi:hypothetical protein